MISTSTSPDPAGIAREMRARQSAMLTLSEAVALAQDQLPAAAAQAWVDAERLVWKALGAT